MGTRLPGQTNYTASKGGLIAMYKSLAIEVAQRNINVNIVSPGFIKSPMTDKLNEEQQNNIMKKPANKKVCLLRESLQRNQQESNRNFNSLREIKELDSWMDPSIAQLD